MLARAIAWLLLPLRWLLTRLEQRRLSPVVAANLAELDLPTYEAFRAGFDRQNHVVSDEIARAIYTGLVAETALLIEGPPGYGKTEVAKSLAAVFETELIRLSCHEDMEFDEIAYSWNFPAQMLATNMAGKYGDVRDLYTDEFLQPRPLYQVATAERRVVFLIDELDKLPSARDAIFLEFLSDWQLSNPEMGRTIVCRRRPIVVITSNNTRDISEALRRRCTYVYLSEPTVAQEAEILARKVPGLAREDAARMAELMAKLRQLRLKKPPSIGEAIAWATAMQRLRYRLEVPLIRQTLPILLKHKQDLDRAAEALG